MLADSLIALGDFFPNGLDETLLNPASVDLTLAPTMRYFPSLGEDEIIDLNDVQPGHTIPYEFGDDDGFLLAPGEFVLGATNEVVHLPATHLACVDGKSSLGRLGLTVHVTAGFIDPGFTGSITLEIANLSPRTIVLRPNLRIAQIRFMPVMGHVHYDYRVTGHYNDQPAGQPVESRYRP